MFVSNILINISHSHSEPSQSFFVSDWATKTNLGDSGSRWLVYTLQQCWLMTRCQYKWSPTRVMTCRCTSPSCSALVLDIGDLNIDWYVPICLTVLSDIHLYLPWFMFQSIEETVAAGDRGRERETEGQSYSLPGPT